MTFGIPNHGLPKTRRVIQFSEGWRYFGGIMKQWILVLIGALAGGVIGLFGFLWIARQGFYALVLPGALLGLGASFFANSSRAICVVCGVLGLALGIVAEWQFAPFIRDASFGYFLTNIHQLRPITLIMIAAGAFIGFWAPFSRRQRIEQRIEK